jgi:hypothetical protein
MAKRTFVGVVGDKNVVFIDEGLGEVAVNIDGMTRFLLIDDHDVIRVIGANEDPESLVLLDAIPPKKRRR